MKKIYCIKYSKYTKFRKIKISCTWRKTLVLSTSCEKGGIDDKIFIFEVNIFLKYWRFLA